MGHARRHLPMNATPIELPHRCLGDTQLIALASGKYAAAQAARLLLQAETCPQCQVLLREAGRAIADVEGDTAALSPLFSSEQAFTPGQLVSERYRIERKLGRGGMGEVYQAFDEELSEWVALKAVRKSFALRANGVDRLRQELRLARRLSHPNLCRVFEFGRHRDTPAADGSYFFTMELLEGRSLSQLLHDGGPLTPRRVIEIGRQLCAGLTAVHHAGILHRDIKACNVMLCRDLNSGRRNRVVLLDFGIARLCEGEGSSPPLNGAQVVDIQAASRLGRSAVTRRFTANAGRVGTPDYMAPEQLAHASTLTTATDLFAVGMVLFELLTGRLPPRPTCARDDARTHRAALDACHLAPPGLAELVARCLAYSPSKRPSSAGEMHAQLDALGAHPALRRAERREVLRAASGN